MKILLIGSGGREHALFWKLSQSPHLTRMDVMPGNGGFPPESIVQENISWQDGPAFRDFVQKRAYDLVVVGPEDPLVGGIADLLEEICPVFGPSAGAAKLEGSKDYSKAFMQKYSIPGADYRTFTDYDTARAYLDGLLAPYVIKTDGLAAGKGVAVAPDLESAEIALKERMLEAKFGPGGQTVIIEEFMPGEEASVFAICDGKHAIPLLASQDHKRAFDGDKGPNTGGMGAYAPVPFITPRIMQKIQTEVLDRAMAGMQAEGHPYKGLLYAGLMIHKGQVRVVEFNVRFGDPETQALVRLIDEDLLDLLYKAATGQLPANYKIKHLDQAAMIVVLAARGYPGSYEKDILLKNIDNSQSDIIFFHAGTRRDGDRLFSSGGRVLGVTATGSNLKEARQKVYSQLKNYAVDGLFFRKDIGEQGL